jgi:hypothetical protein
MTDSAEWNRKTEGQEVRAELVVEVKAVEQLLPVHAAQLISYLSLTGLQAGLLVNFHAETIRRGLRRLTLDPPNPSAHPSSCSIPIEIPASRDGLRPGQMPDPASNFEPLA